MRVQAADGGIPQNIEYDFPADDSSSSITNWLDKLRVTRVDFLDLDGIPAAFAGAVFGGRVPVGVLVPRGRARAIINSANFATPDVSEGSDTEQIWASAIFRAKTLLVTDEHTGQLLKRQFGADKAIVTLSVPTHEHSPPSQSVTIRREARRLGVIGRNDAGDSIIRFSACLQYVPVPPVGHRVSWRRVRRSPAYGQRPDILHRRNRAVRSDKNGDTIWRESSPDH